VLANPKADWVSYTLCELVSFEAKYGDRFCIVIYTGRNLSTAYIVPFQVVRRLLVEDLLIGIGWERLRLIERVANILSNPQDLPLLYERRKLWQSLLLSAGDQRSVIDTLKALEGSARLKEYVWWGQIQQGRLFVADNQKRRERPS